MPSSRANLIRGLLLIVGALTTVETGRGELLVFVQGGRARLPVRIEGETVRVDGLDGKYDFARSDFREIVPGFWPPREWPERSAQAMRGGANARFAAARWALDHGLTSEAETMLRAVVEADASHQPAARMVAQLDRLALACEDPDLDRVQRILPGRFQVARSAHIVLLHQSSEKEAADQVERLERVFRTYYLEFASQGLDLAVPLSRLVSVWFAERDDYLAFLRNERAGAFLSTRGYHHPTRGIVLSYDARSDENQRRAGKALLAKRAHLAEFERRIDEMPASARLRIGINGATAKVLRKAEAKIELARLRRDADREELLLRLSRRRLNEAVAAHELTHQLVAVSRLAPRHDDFPQWLHEGLAMQFEAVRGGEWAGLGEPADLRLLDYRSIHPEPALVPLLHDAGLGRGYRRDPYAAAWALVYFLRRERPAEFLAFLDRLRLPNAEANPGTDGQVAAFRAVFGADLETLESSWHRAISSLPKPEETSLLNDPGETSGRVTD